MFAPGAKHKPRVRAEQPEPKASQTQAAAAGAQNGTVEHTSNKPPRLDGAGLLRRTLERDVFVCGRCGGRRRVLANVTARRGVRAILEHLGLPWQPPRRAPARGPPQSAWC